MKQKMFYWGIISLLGNPVRVHSKGKPTAVYREAFYSNQNTQSTNMKVF